MPRGNPTHAVGIRLDSATSKQIVDYAMKQVAKNQDTSITVADAVRELVETGLREVTRKES